MNHTTNNPNQHKTRIIQIKPHHHRTPRKSPTRHPRRRHKLSSPSMVNYVPFCERFTSVLMKMIGPRCRKTRVRHVAVTTRNYRARAPPTREPQFNNANTDLLTYIQRAPHEIYRFQVNKVCVFFL